MENNLSAENSLRLIAETIERSRRTIAKNSGKPMIFWGILVIVTALVICLLWSRTGNPIWNLLWFAMSAIGGIGTSFLTRDREKVPVSEISRILGKIWMWFGIFATGFYLLIWVAYLLMMWFEMPIDLHVDLTLLIGLMLGLCGAISGTVMNLRSVSVSSVVATALAVLMCLMIPSDSALRILAFVVLGFFALVVPGIILQKKGAC